MKRAAPPVWPQVVPALPPRAARVRPSSSLALCTESGTGLCSCWQSMAVRFGPRVSRSSPCDPKEAGTPQHASARGALAPTGPCPLVPSSSRQTPTKAVTAASRCSAVSKLAHSACEMCTDTFVLPHFCSQAQLLATTERTSSSACAAASMHVATTPHAQVLLAAAYSAALSTIWYKFATWKSKVESLPSATLCGEGSLKGRDPGLHLCSLHLGRLHNLVLLREPVCRPSSKS